MTSKAKSRALGIGLAAAVTALIVTPIVVSPHTADVILLTVGYSAIGAMLIGRLVVWIREQKADRATRTADRAACEVHSSTGIQVIAATLKDEGDESR